MHLYECLNIKKGTKSGILEVKKHTNNNYQDSPVDECTRFKGQMVYLKEKELILFQCSPSLMRLDLISCSSLIFDLFIFASLILKLLASRISTRN